MCNIGNYESFESISGDNSSIFNCMEKQFAFFDVKLMNDVNRTPEEIIKHIDRLENYLSFSDVIREMLKKPEGERKATFKNIN